MGNKTVQILRCCLIAVFLISTLFLILRFISTKREEESSQLAVAIAMGAAGQQTDQPRQDQPVTEPATEPAPEADTAQIRWIPEPVEDDPLLEELAAIDLAALQAVNEQVVGWIRVPGTVINYPIVQGEDNEYYLSHTWEGRSNYSGSIFLECLNSPDFTDFNTIVYGHNMMNGSIFGSLPYYANEGFWKENPYVYIVLADGVCRYQIFSCYQAAVESSAYGLSFRQLETRVNFIDHALSNARYDTGIVPAVTDRILTLSTCTGVGYAHRWVLQCRLPMVPVEAE